MCQENSLCQSPLMVILFGFILILAGVIIYSKQQYSMAYLFFFLGALMIAPFAVIKIIDSMKALKT